MLERYYVRPDTVDRIQASWISGAIEQYVRWLSERNYSEKSILRRVPLLVGFGEFAKGQGVTSWAELPTQVEYYVAHRVKKRFGRRKPSPHRRARRVDYEQ